MIEKWKNEDSARTMVSKFNKLVDSCNDIKSELGDIRDTLSTLNHKVDVSLMETQSLLRDLLE